MALYGVYGSRTTEACPVNNLQTATQLVAFAENDLQPIASKYKIREVVGQYHSALEHTLVWVVDAEDPHLIQDFSVETGIASFNKVKIFPLVTFNEGVIPLIKKIHQL